MLDRARKFVADYFGTSTAKAITSDVPQTAGYEAFGVGIGYFGGYQKRPPFSLWQAELMLLDQQVWFGLCVGNAPLMSAEVTVEGPDDEVNAFVGEQWDRIWSTSASQILRAKYYGFAGSEVMYTEKAGNLEFDHLRDLHPFDTRALRLSGRNDPQQAGRFAGMSVTNIRGFGNTQTPSTNQGKAYVLGPKCLWNTYEAKHGSKYGEPLLIHAFDRWYEKAMEGGAYDLTRLRMVKDAWVGDVLYYDRGKIRKPDGSEASWRDMAREVAEHRTSGGCLTLPMEHDAAGNQKRLLDYQPPTSVAGATQILEWCANLDDGIWKGLLLPGEVVEAAASGSGFSGRSIPFMAYLTVRDNELGQYVRQVKHQVLDFLVIARFGTNRCDYDLKPKPLLETFKSDMGGEQGGAGGFGQAPQPNQPPAQAGQHGGGFLGYGSDDDGADDDMQFAADDSGKGDSGKGKWITIGGHKSGDGKRHGGTPVRIHRGKIVGGPSALRGRSLKEIAERNRPDSRVTQALRQGSKDWRINKRDLKDALDFVHGEKKQAVDEREAAKKRLREITGITQADVMRLENQGKDHTHVKGLDVTARTAAGELPELGMGRGVESGGNYDDTDYAAHAWELIKEGRINPMPKHHPDLIDEAAQLAIANRRYKGDGGEDDRDAVPFSVSAEHPRLEAYREWLGVVQFATAEDDPQARITRKSAAVSSAIVADVGRRLDQLLKKNG